MGLLLWTGCKTPEDSPPPNNNSPDLSQQSSSLTAVASAPSWVYSYATVILDGSYSTDATGTISTYTWKQTAGPPATLTGADKAAATFVAPPVAMPTELAFSLLLSDSASASASDTAKIQVLPATADQLRLEFVDLTLFQTFSGNVHNNLLILDGPPEIGSTLILEATLSGAVATPKFSLVDMNGAVLATPSLSLSGQPWLRPLAFSGPVQIPAVPFKVLATGTSADGKPYSLSSAVVTPMKMSLAVAPPSVLVAKDASTMVSLQIHNAGSDATFALKFNDPGGLLAQAPPSSMAVPAGKTVSVPLTIKLTNAATDTNPLLEATASVTGDASRTGTVTLQVWRNGPPL